MYCILQHILPSVIREYLKLNIETVRQWIASDKKFVFTVPVKTQLCYPPRQWWLEIRCQSDILFLSGKTKVTSTYCFGATFVQSKLFSQIGFIFLASGLKPSIDQKGFPYVLTFLNIWSDYVWIMGCLRQPIVQTVQSNVINLLSRRDWISSTLSDTI